MPLGLSLPRQIIKSQSVTFLSYIIIIKIPHMHCSVFGINFGRSLTQTFKEKNSDPQVQKASEAKLKLNMSPGAD